MRQGRKAGRKMAVLYECDPAKNRECRKVGCAFEPGNPVGFCSVTFREEFARLDENGKPIPHKKGKAGKENGRKKD